MEKLPVEIMVDNVAVHKVPKPPNLKEGDLYATHEGVLDLGGFKMKCFILNNGQRILDAEDVEKFLNIT